MTHYHVLAGLHGCIPSSNDVYETREQANEGLKEIVNQFEDSENKLEGSVEQGYFEIKEKTDSLCDYVEISECQEKECLQEIEE